jgi:hypothetical protein
MAIDSFPPCANAVIDPATGASLLEYEQRRSDRDAAAWFQATGNEFGRLTDDNFPHTISESKPLTYQPQDPTTRLSLHGVKIRPEKARHLLTFAVIVLHKPMIKHESGHTRQAFLVARSSPLRLVSITTNYTYFCRFLILS